METTTPDDAVYSTHKYRWAARFNERRLQHLIDNAENLEALDEHGIPRWAAGVKVIPAGDKQHAVVFTRNRGH